MSWTPTLTELQNLLAGLYDDVDVRRRVATEAGLPVDRIEFLAGSVDAWHRILKAAQDHDRLAELIAIARNEYKRNERTVATLDRIAAQLAAEEAGGNPAADAPPLPPPLSVNHHFICYAPRDGGEHALRLHTALQQAGKRPWLDRARHARRRRPRSRARGGLARMRQRVARPHPRQRQPAKRERPRMAACAAIQKAHRPRALCARR